MSLAPRRLPQNIYQQLVGHLENFFAGVGLMNRIIIDDAIANANAFLENIFPEPQKPKPPAPPPPVTAPPNPVIPPPTQPLIKFHEFILTLTDSDLNIGGHRHRNYKGTLMHWQVPYKWQWQTTLNARRWSWQTTGWKQIWNKQNTTYPQFIKAANALKFAIGAFQVREFRILSGNRRT